MSGPDAIAASAAYLDYARRGRNDWWRYLLAPVLGMAIAVALGVAILLPLVMMHRLPPDIADQLTHPTHPVIFFVNTALDFGITLVGFVAAIALIHRKSPLALIGAWRWPLFAGGAGVWLAVLAVATLADLLIAPSGFRLSADNATWGLAIGAALALPIQTFAEEVVFRGYVTQGLLLATKRPLAAAVLAGLIFGAVHIPNGIPQAIGAAGFGVVTSLIAIRFAGIAFTFGLHLVNNLFGAVIVVSSGDVFAGAPGVFTQTTPRLTWWDVAMELLALAVVGWLVLRRGPGPAATPIALPASPPPPL